MFPPLANAAIPPGIVFEHVRAATAHEVAITPSHSYVRSVLPEAFDYTRSAETDFTLLPRARSAVNALDPSTGVFTPDISVRAELHVSIKKPKAAARTLSRVVAAQARAGNEIPHAGAVTPDVNLPAKAYFAYWTPETVQNPTEEMMMLL